MKPLRELNIKLKDKPQFQITFLYSVSIYSFIFEGYPTKEMGLEILESMKQRAATLCKMCMNVQLDPPFIFEEDQVGKIMLPHRGNIAVIDDGDRMGTIIWFDDESLEAKESLSRIIDKVGFEQLTYPYFF
jgi:hypothetical protein